MSTLIGEENFKAPNHLRVIFGDSGKETILRGEYERLRCLDRELRALKDAIGDAPLESTLVQGTVLKSLLDLI